MFSSVQSRVQRLEKDKADLAARLADAETRLVESDGRVSALTNEIKVCLCVKFLCSFLDCFKVSYGFFYAGLAS
jgi:hypothetical protein